MILSLKCSKESIHFQTQLYNIRNIIIDIKEIFQMNLKKTHYSVGWIYFDNNKTDYIELVWDLKISIEYFIKYKLYNF